MHRALFAIPQRVRRAVLSRLSSYGASPERIVRDLGERSGFVTYADIRDFLSARFGEDARAQFFGDLGVHVTGLNAEIETSAQEVLLAVPDALFIEAVELGWRCAVGFAADRMQPTAQMSLEWTEYVTDVFASNGVPYHYDDDLRLVPSMSPAVSASSIQPAVEVLNDPRLSVARHHFTEALRRLEEPDPDEAVDEARQAIEAAMIAVLNATGLSMPARRQPGDLFDALAPSDETAPRAMSRDALEIVLAAPRFRGRTSAGHSGGAPVTLPEAQAAVAAAAAGLLYLAAKLP
jgi:HEPN domain-containing protein